MPKKFLIGQLACYGDCLFATTIAKQIKHDHPGCHITWAVAARYRSILEHNPDIDAIWEIAVPGNDFYNIGWNNFEAAAKAKKANGDFDEIIFSQIHPLNWVNYNGTIRGTTLSTYNKPITVSRDPVVQLTAKEEEQVLQFALRNNLKDFKQVVLFECAPGSGQSKLTPQFALAVAKKITALHKDVCFILSTPNKLQGNDRQIIDASELTFRQNAALTHYCTLLIGCSSGITWISTSTAAKKLPMIQLLNAKGFIFAGVHYDFEINKIDNSQLIELVDYDERKIENVLQDYFSNGIIVAKAKHHQSYKPGYYYLKEIIRALIYQKKSRKDIYKMIRLYRSSVDKFSINYLDFFYQIYIYRLKNSDNKIIQFVKRIIKSLIGKKHIA